MLNGCSPKDFVHFLGAIELVRQGVEEAIALD